jgi:hypothetical protein
MKKVFNWILIGTLVIILFIAVVTTYDALTKRKERKIAEANAISYIEKKYGFTPTITDSDKYYDSSFNFDIVISYSKKATDYYRVNMEHDDKSFTVYSPYTGKSWHYFQLFSRSFLSLSVSQSGIGISWWSLSKIVSSPSGLW